MDQFKCVPLSSNKGVRSFHGSFHGHRSKIVGVVVNVAVGVVALIEVVVIGVRSWIEDLLQVRFIPIQVESVLARTTLERWPFVLACLDE